VHLTESPDKIQWHPAFCAATEFELKDNIHELQLISEYNLSKQPIRMDLLIVKNNNNGKAVKIKNEIGYIMKTYNIIEYKSPADVLTIDDFVKIDLCDVNIVMYVSNSLNIKRYYKDVELNNLVKHHIFVNNDDIVINGLGFIKVFGTGYIDIYTIDGVLVYTRDSLI